MFNNQIYGLTKGQYSPTSEVAKVTKSTPFGSLDTPFNPLSAWPWAPRPPSSPAPTTWTAPTCRRPSAGPTSTTGRPSSRCCRTATSSTTAPSRRSPSQDDRAEHAHPAGPRPAHRLRSRGRGARRGPAVRRRASTIVSVAEVGTESLLVHDENERTRVWPSPCPAWPRAPTSRRRSACSEPSSGPSTGPRCPSRSCRPRRSVAWATSPRCCARAPAGRSTSSISQVTMRSAPMRAHSIAACHS